MPQRSFLKLFTLRGAESAPRFLPLTSLLRVLVFPSVGNLWQSFENYITTQQARVIAQAADVAYPSDDDRDLEADYVALRLLCLEILSAGGIARMDRALLALNHFGLQAVPPRAIQVFYNHHYHTNHTPVRPVAAHAVRPWVHRLNITNTVLQWSLGVVIAILGGLGFGVGKA